MELERIEECFMCNSQNIRWECVPTGVCYCDDCAEEVDYTCKTCGSLLRLIE